MKFVIEQSRYTSKNDEHFNAVFGAVLEQINNIRNQILSKYPSKSDFIDNIEQDVFKNENLTPSWDIKLGMLYESGVLK